MLAVASELQIDIRLMVLVLFYRISDNGAFDACSPPDKALIGTTCFSFHHTRLTWSNAKVRITHRLKACEEQENLLAKVESKSQIREIFLSMSLIVVQTGTFPVWVGARDINRRNVFFWMDDGALVVEDVWKEKEPWSSPTTMKHCAAVDSNLTLSSFDCELLKPYLCMHEVPLKMTYLTVSHALYCHCSDGNCDVAGNCPTSNKCARRWFGPGCQQRSLPNSLEGIFPILFDNDDTTCLGTTVNSLNMSFGHSYHFTWVRVVLNQTGQLNDFQLHFPGQGVNCTMLLNVVIAVNTVDLYCPTSPTKVNNVIVTWTGLKVLCSFYVNGGKNLVPLYASVSSTAPPQLSLAPVDGEKAKNVDCVSETFYPIMPHYTVNFPNEMIAREIILYRRINPNGYQHLDETVYLGIPKIVMNASKGFSTAWMGLPEAKLVLSVVVTVSKPNILIRKGNLSICELEIFGECANGTYGLLCQHKCIDRCLTDDCLDTGACFHGERPTTTKSTTTILTTRKLSTHLTNDTTPTVYPVTNSTNPTFPSTHSTLCPNETTAKDNIRKSSTKKKPKTKRKYTTAFPNNIRRDYINKLRLTATVMGVSVSVLGVVTGVIYLLQWRSQRARDDSSDDDDSTAEPDSNLTTSKNTSTSVIDLNSPLGSQNKIATKSAHTLDNFMSRNS